ncbi:hypothetical protein PHLGIDRAFT_213940 [Phlebiopsis gigantea 11061_1 CR5-6]|uniref:Uncharacterized protein n=1 Tax=Phlebiopsis gigantea (strain 11061_1 CR5-6) TaxID=745531 RepID=A0A0C3RTG7_PHLG1|nr:hypothetical protein PHLGIDRAFT_213940 [Phlebiopsis gigantea 11061_1 CR5-6]
MLTTNSHRPSMQKRRLVELQRDREVAERAHKNAHQCTRAVKQAEREAEEGLRQAFTAQCMAREAAADAKTAMLKAKMAYDVAKGICEEEEYRVGNAQISYGQALRRRKEATMRRANAENAELDCQAERERVKRKEEVLKGSIFEEAAEDSVDDQNTQAEKRRYEQHKKEREALQERKERAKTEVKGLEEMLRVLEKSDPSEPDKNKPEATYKIALLKERIRCKQRDLSWYEELDASDEERAIARFTQISSDFDIIKFGSSQPLTPDSVPWPNLSSPDDPPSRFIDWETVENFFSAAKRSLGPGEYKSLVEQTHRRFHPDKWRSRGLFATVLNEELRSRLEEGVNIVSQAITPLWQRSRA